MFLKCLLRNFLCSITIKTHETAFLLERCIYVPPRPWLLIILAPEETMSAIPLRWELFLWMMLSSSFLRWIVFLFLREFIQFWVSKMQGLKGTFCQLRSKFFLGVQCLLLAVQVIQKPWHLLFRVNLPKICSNKWPPPCQLTLQEEGESLHERRKENGEWRR